jgi:hypothetical protein
MKAVEFVFNNADSTDRFWLQNLRTFVCADCTYNQTCKKGDSMPVISPLSRYIMRWHSEQKIVPGYPLPGTWEDQPAWFSSLMSACANKFAALDAEKMKAK